MTGRGTRPEPEGKIIISPLSLMPPSLAEKTVFMLSSLLYLLCAGLAFLKGEVGGEWEMGAVLGACFHCNCAGGVCSTLTSTLGTRWQKARCKREVIVVALVKGDKGVARLMEIPLCCQDQKSTPSPPPLIGKQEKQGIRVSPLCILLG